MKLTAEQKERIMVTVHLGTAFNDYFETTETYNMEAKDTYEAREMLKKEYNIYLIESHDKKIVAWVY
mgnify:CR=1 FL=1